MNQLDHPIRGVGDAPKDVAGTRPLVAAVGGNPVGTGAEVVTRAEYVDGPQRVIGGGVGQRVDELPRSCYGSTSYVAPADRA